MASTTPSLVVLIVFLLSSTLLFGTSQASNLESNATLQLEHIGVPFPSWSSPVNSHPSSLLENPHWTRESLLVPRFHRFLRYGQSPDSKTQTAIFVAGRSGDHEEDGRPGASVISALNPRNGAIGMWKLSNVCVSYPFFNSMALDLQQRRSHTQHASFIRM